MKHLLILILLLCSSLTASADVTPWAWDAKLGDNIRIRLEVEESTFGTLIGKTTYFRRNGKKAVIPCYGHCIKHDDDERIHFLLDEYVGIEQCGHFYIIILNGEIQEAYWTYHDKRYDMNSIVDLNPTPGTEYNYSPISNINEACGDYFFIEKTGNDFFPEYMGSCTITKTGPNTIHWSMGQVTPNIAEAEGDSEIDGAYFKGSFGNFKFEAYIDRRFIFVKNTNEAPFTMEDWGAWATIAGIYIRK